MRWGDALAACIIIGFAVVLFVGWVERWFRRRSTWWAEYDEEEQALLDREGRLNAAAYAKKVADDYERRVQFTKAWLEPADTERGEG